MREKNKKMQIDGRKTLKVSVVFWTNNIAKMDGEIKPRHAWGAGIVRLKANRLHGVRKQEDHFYSIEELGEKIKKILRSAKVKLHKHRRSENIESLAKKVATQLLNLAREGNL